jgi:hypothetical protein
MTSLTDVSNQTKMILGPIRQAWRWLTKPSDTITTGAERRNAQFLVALLLVNIPFLAIRILVAVRSGSIYTDPAMVVFNLLFLLVCVAYGLSRSRHYKIATTLYIGAFTLALFGVVFIRGEYD